MKGIKIPLPGGVAKILKEFLTGVVFRRVSFAMQMSDQWSICLSLHHENSPFTGEAEFMTDLNFPAKAESKHHCPSPDCSVNPF
ncbi:hypothetical protein FY557_02510 [Chryseobacterium sp. SN22]|uniref:hypothetical protein n=1 Tax=Chryseobacterium sp. SN22 TaxID=2606431 RepID=UPI0011EEF7D2|nr:hypothetical protein [Chryseobacterium sp. SN22]KAA0130121.1 hypothetical protein FY557_02510 [Chryseobacterium sp. SN22]